MIRPGRFLIASLLPLATLVTLAGCTLPQPESTAYHAATAYKPPACTHAGKAVPLPPGFPTNFPLPARTIITEVFQNPNRPTSVNGFIGSSDFGATVQFFDDYLPLSGFTVARVPGLSSESITDTFIGHGYAGKLTLGPLPPTMCAGEVLFGAYAVPGSQVPVDTY